MYVREVQPQSPDPCSFLPAITYFLPVIVLPLHPTAVLHCSQQCAFPAAGGRLAVLPPSNLFKKQIITVASGVAACLDPCCSLWGLTGLSPPHLPPFHFISLFSPRANPALPVLCSAADTAWPRVLCSARNGGCPWGQARPRSCLLSPRGSCWLPLWSGGGDVAELLSSTLLTAALG